MGFASSYFPRHRFFEPFIQVAPQHGTSLIVVIPSFNEPDLSDSLNSLYNANRPSFPVEIIVAVNSPEGAGTNVIEQNRKTVTRVHEWCSEYSHPGFNVHVIDVPPFAKKHAGAGFARKAGMDEALHRFNILNNDKGIIVSFDADSTCDKNYFTEIEKCFSIPEITGCNIYFEHPLSGEKESSAVYRAITQYELYLRYFVQAMRLAGFPYAFHTIGSSFAVNAKIYALQGGMNRKKAGEDFYFLHKIFPLGNFTELNTTRVIPSSRVSERVPFGTGATMKKLTGNDTQGLKTYPLKSFEELAMIFTSVPDLFGADEKVTLNVLQNLPECLGSYLKACDFVQEVNRMNIHSAATDTFRKRFFTWFNAFRLLKYLNYAKNNCRNDQPVQQAAGNLLARLNKLPHGESLDLLIDYRKLQRETIWRS